MNGNKLSNYYLQIGSYQGAIKINGKWCAAKDLNRIDKSKMYRWQGHPSLAIVNAMKEKPLSANILLPHLTKRG